MRLLWREAGFNVGVVGRLDDVDVLFGFGFLSFEGVACRIRVVERRERGGLAMGGFFVVDICVGWSEGVRGFIVFDCAEDVYLLRGLLACGCGTSNCEDVGSRRLRLFIQVAHDEGRDLLCRLLLREVGESRRSVENEVLAGIVEEAGARRPRFRFTFSMISSPKLNRP